LATETGWCFRNGKGDAPAKDAFHGEKSERKTFLTVFEKAQLQQTVKILLAPLAQESVSRQTSSVAPAIPAEGKEIRRGDFPDTFFF